MSPVITAIIFLFFQIYRFFSRYANLSDNKPIIDNIGLNGEFVGKKKDINFHKKDCKSFVARKSILTTQNLSQSSIKSSKNP
ncbi:MAG: hypothetical protein CMC96_09500 [Flavobacteriales bacterium]|nr:hypothetical protein [Flavobacteriales bacterium]